MHRGGPEPDEQQPRVGGPAARSQPAGSLLQAAPPRPRRLTTLPPDVDVDLDVDLDHDHDLAHDAPAIAALVDDLAAVVGVDLDADARAALLAGDVDRLSGEATTSTNLIAVCRRLHVLAELHKPLGAWTQTTVFDEAHRRSWQQLADVVDHTRRVMRPLAADVDVAGRAGGLTGAVDDAIENACRNQRDHPVTPGRGLWAVFEATLAGTGAMEGDDASGLEDLPTLLSGGVDRVLLHLTNVVDDRSAIAVVARAVALCQPFHVELLVAGRADLALAAGASGVFVGPRDVPPAIARSLLRATGVVGVAHHTLAGLREHDVADIVHDGADHLGLGPVWSDPRDPHDAVGLDVLAAACASTDKRVVASGGIVDVARVVDVARAGAAWAAVDARAGGAFARAGDDDDALHLRVRRFCLAFAAADAHRR